VIAALRIDELQAAVLRVKLKYLDGWTEARQRNAAFYDAAFAAAGLADRLETPQAAKTDAHFHQYVVRVQNRDALKEFWQKRSIGTRFTIRFRCICRNASLLEPRRR